MNSGKEANIQQLAGKVILMVSHLILDEAQNARKLPTATC